MLIGIVVSVVLFKKMANALANHVGVWTGTFWSTARRKKKVEPGIGDYIGASIWSVILIPAWPFRVLWNIWIWYELRKK